MKKMIVTMMMALLTTVGTSSVTNASATEASFDTSSGTSLSAVERVDATSWFPPYSEIVNTDSILAELTEEQYYETLRNSIPMEHFQVESSEIGPKKVSPRAAIMAWSFADLLNGGHFSNEFNVTNFGGGSQVNLRITVVQWASDGSDKKPELLYGLVNRNYQGKPVVISGKFTHTNTSRELAVPAGTYQVQVTNSSSFAVTGNGNIAYY